MQYCMDATPAAGFARLITIALSWGALPAIVVAPAHPVLSATGPIKKIPRTYRRCRAKNSPWLLFPAFTSHCRFPDRQSDYPENFFGLAQVMDLSGLLCGRSDAPLPVNF